MDEEHSESLRFAKTVIPLFREYRQKLDGLRAEAKSLYKEASHLRNDSGRTHLQQQYIALHSSFHRLRPALDHFARQVSQRLDHIYVDDVSRIEIELRLIDFESDVELTEQYFGSMFF